MLILILFSYFGYSQNLNSYKYALVPSKFSFLKEKNQYNLNVLSKMYMQQLGFETYFETDQAPKDFLENNCNKVYFDVLENNNMFATKLTIVLKDCRGKIVYTSIEGTNKEKEYRISYNLALREALKSMNEIQYKYNNEQLNDEKTVTKVVANEFQSQSINLDSQNIVQLYAQPILNGFQIIDSEPKVIFKIYKTSTKEVYIAYKGNLQGIMISKNNECVFEYYQNEKLITEKVNISLN